MSLTKTARFPGRVDARRKGALTRREANLKQYSTAVSTQKLPEDEVATLTLKIERATTDVSALKKKLRIKE